MPAVPDNAADRDLGARISKHYQLAAALAGHDDSELTSLIAAGQDGIVGIGGTATRIEIDDTAVFVKRIPLTDLERHPTTVGSTANLFGLPAHCHYGVGSPGFGAWRELAATTTASNWVLARHSHSFPLLHHWRVLPGVPPPGDELHDIEASVAYWGGHTAMRDRLHALAAASWSLVLFLEHIPSTLSEWLDLQTTHGEQAAHAAATMLEDQLLAGTIFIANRGMVHFDPHFDNVLTDGNRLYFADLGLAATTDFALSTDEARLVEHARTHDISYVIARLVNWTVATFGDPACASDHTVRHEHVRAYAHGTATPELPGPAAAIIRRFAPVAAIVNTFYAELFTARRDAPYPAAAIDSELARLAATDQLPRSLVSILNR